MDHHQLSEPYAESETSRHPADLENTVLLDGSSHHVKKNGKEPISNGDTENGPTIQEGGWRAAPSSDLEWSSTTDTSIHTSSSLSEVPTKVLEECDGLDDASLYSESSATLPAPPRDRGRGQANSRAGRGQSRSRGASRTRGRKAQLSNGKSSDGSGSSSSFDTSNSSTGPETESSTCSHTSCNESFDSSELSEENSSSSGSSFTSCSCSCHSGESSTSFESLDDLTSVPRAKRRGARLGQKGTRKIAEQCQQS